VTEDSVLAVQIFDQKKFKKKDQGFLGVVNVRIGNVIDLDAGGDGMSRPRPAGDQTSFISVAQCTAPVGHGTTHIFWQAQMNIARISECFMSDRGAELTYSKFWTCPIF
jgi:hypothetical protein